MALEICKQFLLVLKYADSMLMNLCLYININTRFSLLNYLWYSSSNTILKCIDIFFTFCLKDIKDTVNSLASHGRVRLPQATCPWWTGSSWTRDSQQSWSRCGRSRRCEFTAICDMHRTPQKGPIGSMKCIWNRKEDTQNVSHWNQATKGLSVWLSYPPLHFQWTRVVFHWELPVEKHPMKSEEGKTFRENKFVGMILSVH